MKATPLKVQGNVDSYTRFRTSKVMYMNEAVYPVAKSISRNIDLAMKFNVQSKYGSENYQVMEWNGWKHHQPFRFFRRVALAE